MVEPLVVSPSGVDAIALGDNAAFEHDGVLVQHDGIGTGEVGRSLTFVRDPRFVGTGFFAGEAPDGLTTVYGDPIPADVFVYWRDPDDPMAQEVLVGATKSAPDGTWRITGLNYNLRYVVRARTSGRDDVTVVGVQPSRMDVINYEGEFTNNEDFDSVDGEILIASGLSPFTVSVVEPLPSGLFPVIDGRKLIIYGTSDDGGVWNSVVRVTASNGVWVDVPVQVLIVIDPYFDDVALLLHLDGGNGSTNFIDVKGKTVSSVGNAVISTDEYQFGGASAYFDGNGDHLLVPASADFDFGVGDMTIECFVFINEHSLPDAVNRRFAHIVSIDNGSFEPLSFFITGNDSVTGTGLGVWRGDNYQNADATISNKEWHHIAISRQSGTLRFFLDGVLLKSVSYPYPLGGSSHSLKIGGRSVWHSNYHYYLNGYIDELRITKGVGRYSSTFTPPSRPFPNQ